MSYEIKNKVVLITGGAAGIGAEVVKLFLKEEAKFVAVLDVDEEAGLSLQNELNTEYGSEKVKFIRCDVSNEEELLASYNTTQNANGTIDIVINNAGIMNDSVNVYKKSIEVNYTALVTSTLKALELMRKDCGGSGGAIVNISSIAALYQDPLMPIYFGTKSAVLQFSNCIGLPEYYSRTGVRVIAVCFGATSTSLLTAAKLGSFEDERKGLVLEALKEIPCQSPESAAVGVIEAYKRGKSGTTWLATHNDPVKDITATIKKAYSLLASEEFY